MRWTEAQRTKSVAFRSESALFTAAASNDASYARKILTSDSAFISKTHKPQHKIAGLTSEHVVWSCHSVLSNSARVDVRSSVSLLF